MKKLEGVKAALFVYRAWHVGLSAPRSNAERLIKVILISAMAMVVAACEQSGSNTHATQISKRMVVEKKECVIERDVHVHDGLSVVI